LDVHNRNYSRLWRLGSNLHVDKNDNHRLHSPFGCSVSVDLNFAFNPGDSSTTAIVIQSQPTRFVAYSFGEFLGRVAGAYIERRNDTAEDRFLTRAMTLGDLRRMDTDNDGVVSPVEFLNYMLVALQKVDQEDIDEIMDLFRNLDKTRTGTINKADLEEQYHLSVKPGVTMNADHQLSVAPQHA
jgi:hypothetical protein